MNRIPRLQQISDYIKAVNINVPGRLADLLFIDYEKVNLDHANWLPAFRPAYFEINLDITAGCPIKVDEFALASVPNRLTLVSPHRLQSSVPGTAKTSNRPYKGYGLFFSPDFVAANYAGHHFLKDFPFFSPLNTPSLFLDAEATTHFVDIFNKIQYEYDNYGVYSKEIVNNYLHILFLKARQYYHYTSPAHTINREQEIFRAFELLVQKHFLELSTVREYADKMHITPKHLSETVKKVSGDSALQLIHRAQLSYAKTQLLQTGKTVAQIAGELNFENADYFSVFFKRLTGKSPLQFRAFATQVQAMDVLNG